MNIGDFSVTDRALEQARDAQSKRSSRSRGVDEEQRAPITTRANVWEENPDEYDFPGIDTPTENPNLLPKDLQTREKGLADVNPKASGRQPPDAAQIPSDEAEMSFLQSRDVTLTPEEAYEGKYTEHGSDYMGRRPSSQSLSEDAFQGLASGPEADLSFVEAERERTQENDPDSLFDL